MGSVFRLFLLPCLLWLAACAAPPGPVDGLSELDISQLVQTEPADLRVVDVLPRGLGSGGEAVMLFQVEDENPEVAAQEIFDLRLVEERYEPEAQRTLAIYVLQPGDHDRFTQAQIRLRAQLIAGYAQVLLLADSAVCDEAGVALSSGQSPLLIQNAATGRTILTIRPTEPLRDIKERVEFCT